MLIRWPKIYFAVAFLVKSDVSKTQRPKAMEDGRVGQNKDCDIYVQKLENGEENGAVSGLEGLEIHGSAEQSSALFYKQQELVSAEIAPTSCESGEQTETSCALDTPTESQDTPTESQDTPNESQDTPTESQDTPTESQDQDGDFFCWMPQEIVRMILSYLRPQELSVSVAPVCRRWHDVARDPVLWQELDIATISSLHLCQVVRQCTCLRKLVLQGRDQISVAEAMVVTDFCTLLQELDLGFSRGVDVHRLEPFVQKCPNLESINVEGCVNVDTTAVRMLARAPKLCRLNFSHCTRLGDEDVIHLAQSLPKITALNIDGICWITDESVIQLVQRHSAWLTSLVLDGEKLSDSSIEAISECKHLTQLSLSFSQALTDASLIFILELPHLRRLCLKKGSELTSRGLREMFEGPCLSALRHLNLSECTALNDEGVLSLAKCCGPNLVDLQLCWCWDITDTGLVAILDHCKKLRSLILLGLHSLRGEWLDRIHEELMYLKFLDLQGCNEIQDDLIITLVKRKADIKVLDYFGQEYQHSSQVDDIMIPDS